MVAPPPYTRWTAPQPTRRARRADGPRWARISLTVAAILLVLWSIWTFFGLDGLFFYEDVKTADDLKIRREEAMFDMGWGFILPVDPMLLLIALLSFGVCWAGGHFFVVRPVMTKASFIMVVIVFALSLPKWLMPFGWLGYGFGESIVASRIPSDLRTPTAEQAPVSDVQLVRYTDDNFRVTGVVTNATDDVWEEASVNLAMLDDAGTVCAASSVELEWMTPGQSEMVATQRYGIFDRECEPTHAEVVVNRYDRDSRTIETSIPARVPSNPFAELHLIEREDNLGLTRVHIEGRLTEEALAALSDGERVSAPEVQLEMVRADGVREGDSWLWDYRNIDGTVATQEFHSPVDPGEFVGVAVVPGNL